MVFASHSYHVAAKEMQLTSSRVLLSIPSFFFRFIETSHFAFKLAWELLLTWAALCLGTSEKDNKADTLKKTVQVSNLSPLLTVEQLKQLFGFCGTVVDCTITDSKHFAYIEYSKPEEATAALALNNMDLGGRPLNVEMAKSLPQKPAVSLASSLPIMMQQAVAMQQMQFQQALLMQQTMTAQQAANRAATVKSATELASARAAEITKKLKAEGFTNDEKEPERKSRYMLI